MLRSWESSSRFLFDSIIHPLISYTSSSDETTITDDAVTNDESATDDRDEERKSESQQQHQPRQRRQSREFNGAAVQQHRASSDRGHQRTIEAMVMLPPINKYLL